VGAGGFNKLNGMGWEFFVNKIDIDIDINV